MKTFLQQAARWVVVLALAGFTVRAQQPPPGAVDEKTVEVTKAFCAVLTDSERLAFTLNWAFRHESGWSKQENYSTWAVAKEKPNRFSWVLVTKMPSAISLVSDGTELTAYIPQWKAYTVLPAPATWKDFEKNPLFSAAMPKDPLSAGICWQTFSADPYSDMMDAVTAGEYKGIEPIDGKPCHRLHFTQDNFDWDMWIHTEGQPVVRRVVADIRKEVLTKLAESKDEEARDMFTPKELSLTFDYTDWVVDGELPANTFAFQPPPNVKRDDEKFKKILESAGQESEEEDADAADAALLGQPAPAIKLEMLDGGTFDLVQHKGKVVVLDFWATWCGPCRRTLPILAETITAFKGQEVVFCAINQQETADLIRSFLQKNELAIPVALDSESVVGTRYKVSGIPKGVLIGRDGTVQAIHVGFDPELKATLAQEIQSLLDGKALVSPAAP